MATPLVGEMRQVGFNFVPPGWLACNGALISIATYDLLYALIGTTYGGDGVSTFALPDMRGRLSIHQGSLPGGSSYVMGQLAGTESLTLTTPQMVKHSHNVAVADALGTIPNPTANCTWAQVTPDSVTSITAYAPAPGNATLAPTLVSSVGGSLPIDIRQPFLVLNWIIATAGIFPSQA